MENEFNPTKKDLLNIESRILDIRTEKNKYVGRKISLQNTLSVLHGKYRTVKHNSPEFNRIKNTREHVKMHLNGIELKIKTLNDELSFKNKLKLEVEHHLRSNPGADNKELAKVINRTKALREKYFEFTKDKTRIASLRVLAAEFVTELENLTKDL